MTTLFLDLLPTIIEWDKWLLSKINGEWHNSFLDMIYPYWRARSTWIPIYVIIVGFIFWKYRKSGIQIFAAIAITIAVANIISSELIKKTVQRTRPCRETAIQIRPVANMDCSSGYSFTSSHSTNHFAMSWALIFFVPAFRRNGWWKIALLFWAASIAYGQAYVAVHYPVDIMCGALLGTLIAYLFYRLYGWLQYKNYIIRV